MGEGPYCLSTCEILILTNNIQSCIRTLSNIKHGVFCENSSWLKAVWTIFAKPSILDVWQGSEYASDISSKHLVEMDNKFQCSGYIFIWL